MYVDTELWCTWSPVKCHVIIRLSQPMPQIEHNGDNFEYIVTYQPRGDSTEAEVTDVITDWTKGRLVIPNQPTFQEYVISVGTRNEMGAGPVTTILGYSGEDGKLIVTS